MNNNLNINLKVLRLLVLKKFGLKGGVFNDFKKIYIYINFYVLIENGFYLVVNVGYGGF